VAKITDRSLRKALRKEVDLLLEKLRYGLNYMQIIGRFDRGLARLHGLDAVQIVAGLTADADPAVPPDLVVYSSTVSGLCCWKTQVVAVGDLMVVREFGDAIYPGLESTGKVERGGDKPPHLVINSENFHALELLLYTHRGKLDAIYIDPPYNTRDRDWKYNNDYVDSSDVYGPSMWLAMMERRLQLAAELHNPDDSVLIVTIDEKE
jgi:adenine-specific DNA-methyltransferase